MRIPIRTAVQSGWRESADICWSSQCAKSDFYRDRQVSDTFLSIWSLKADLRTERMGSYLYAANKLELYSLGTRSLVLNLPTRSADKEGVEHAVLL